MTYPTHRRGRRWRLNWQVLLGIALIIAAAYLVGAQYRAGELAQERGECQARVNTQVVAALQVRDDANRKITEAQRDVVATRVRTDDPDERKAADRRYIAALDQLQRTRDANPLAQQGMSC